MKNKMIYIICLFLLWNISGFGAYIHEEWEAPSVANCEDITARVFCKDIHESIKEILIQISDKINTYNFSLAANDTLVKELNDEIFEKKGESIYPRIAASDVKIIKAYSSKFEDQYNIYVAFDVSARNEIGVGERDYSTYGHILYLKKIILIRDKVKNTETIIPIKSFIKKDDKEVESYIIANCVQEDIVKIIGNADDYGFRDDSTDEIDSSGGTCSITNDGSTLYILFGGLIPKLVKVRDTGGGFIFDQGKSLDLTENMQNYFKWDLLNAEDRDYGINGHVFFVPKASAEKKDCLLFTFNINTEHNSGVYGTPFEGIYDVREIIYGDDDNYSLSEKPICRRDISPIYDLCTFKTFSSFFDYSTLSLITVNENGDIFINKPFSNEELPRIIKNAGVINSSEKQEFKICSGTTGGIDVVNINPSGCGYRFIMKYVKSSAVNFGNYELILTLNQLTGALNYEVYNLQTGTPDPDWKMDTSLLQNKDLTDIKITYDGNELAVYPVIGEKSTDGGIYKIDLNKKNIYYHRLGGYISDDLIQNFDLTSGKLNNNSVQYMVYTTRLENLKLYSGHIFDEHSYATGAIKCIPLESQKASSAFISVTDNTSADSDIAVAYSDLSKAIYILFGKRSPDNLCNVIWAGSGFITSLNGTINSFDFDGEHAVFTYTDSTGYVHYSIGDVLEENGIIKYIQKANNVIPGQETEYIKATIKLHDNKSLLTVFNSQGISFQNINITGKQI